MDDASVISVPAKESSPGDGHRPSPVADRASAERCRRGWPGCSPTACLIELGA